MKNFGYLVVLLFTSTTFCMEESNSTGINSGKPLPTKSGSPTRTGSPSYLKRLGCNVTDSKIKFTQSEDQLPKLQNVSVGGRNREKGLTSTEGSVPPSTSPEVSTSNLMGTLSKSTEVIDIPTEEKKNEERPRSGSTPVQVLMKDRQSPLSDVNEPYPSSVARTNAAVAKQLRTRLLPEEKKEQRKKG